VAFRGGRCEKILRKKKCNSTQVDPRKGGSPEVVEPLHRRPNKRGTEATMAKWAMDGIGKPRGHQVPHPSRESAIASKRGSAGRRGGPCPKKGEEKVQGGGAPSPSLRQETRGPNVGAWTKKWGST